MSQNLSSAAVVIGALRVKAADPGVMVGQKFKFLFKLIGCEAQEEMK